MSEDALQKLKKIIADVLGLDETSITQSFSYRDTDRWDSLKHMEIITSLEQNYSVTFTVDEIVNMTSVEEIMRILNQKNAEGA